VRQIQVRRRASTSRPDEASPSATASPRTGHEAVDSLLLEIDELLA
jgi:hypothetical protein